MDGDRDIVDRLEDACDETSLCREAAGEILALREHVTICQRAVQRVYEICSKSGNIPQFIHLIGENDEKWLRVSSVVNFEVRSEREDALVAGWPTHIDKTTGKRVFSVAAMADCGTQTFIGLDKAQWEQAKKLLGFEG